MHPRITPLCFKVPAEPTAMYICAAKASVTGATPSDHQSQISAPTCKVFPQPLKGSKSTTAPWSGKFRSPIPVSARGPTRWAASRNTVSSPMAYSGHGVTGGRPPTSAGAFWTEAIPRDTDRFDCLPKVPWFHPFRRWAHNASRCIPYSRPMGSGGTGASYQNGTLHTIK